jgi:hypothetical protein
MDLPAYVKVICRSLSEQGYDHFYPSICAVEDTQVVMKVLYAELSEAGEEELALKWAESFFANEKTVFVAYRRGQRKVTVLENLGFDTIRKQEITVNPQRGGDADAKEPAT